MAAVACPLSSAMGCVVVACLEVEAPWHLRKFQPGMEP